MSNRFLPNQPVHAHTLQEVISCCCFHFAFSRQMFYSFPGMVIILMKGETGIELIMFYGSKTQWGLCVFARVFFSQLAEWLTLPGGYRAPATDGDQYEAWDRHPWEFFSLGCQSCLPALISYSRLNVFIIICIVFLHVISFFIFMVESKHSFTYAVSHRGLGLHQSCCVVFRVQTSNKLMSGCCRLISVSWCGFCLHDAQTYTHISFFFFFQS